MLRRTQPLGGASLCAGACDGASRAPRPRPRPGRRPDRGAEAGDSVRPRPCHTRSCSRHGGGAGGRACERGAPQRVVPRLARHCPGGLAAAPRPGGPAPHAPGRGRWRHAGVLKASSTLVPACSGLALTAPARRSEAFDLFDTDGSGVIDAKELKVAMRCAASASAPCPSLAAAAAEAACCCQSSTTAAGTRPAAAAPRPQPAASGEPGAAAHQPGTAAALHPTAPARRVRRRGGVIRARRSAQAAPSP